MNKQFGGLVFWVIVTLFTVWSASLPPHAPWIDVLMGIVIGFDIVNIAFAFINWTRGDSFA